MSRKYPAIAFGKAVQDVQQEEGVRQFAERLEASERIDWLMGDREAEMISRLDHFFLGTITESGWPYIQHKGGPQGFLKVLDERTLGYADFQGNRQYISVGNVRTDDRVALFLLEYATRLRLKVFARAEVRAMDQELQERLIDPGYPGRPERAVLFTIEALDWNCPQHITQRFSVDELRLVDPEVLSEILAEGR